LGISPGKDNQHEAGFPSSQHNSLNQQHYVFLLINGMKVAQRTYHAKILTHLDHFQPSKTVRLYIQMS
jgi:hypothetical protein